MNNETNEVAVISPENGKTPENSGVSTILAEGVGFEPTVQLPVLLISSQVPLTTQPPFQPVFFLTVLLVPCYHLSARADETS